MLKLRALPAFTDNYLWLLDNGASALVVDPGDAAPVQAFLQQHALQLSVILLTHHHADHIGGVSVLQRAYPLASIYGPQDPRVPAGIRLHPGQRFSVEQLEMQFEVLDLSGHTRSHIGYLASGNLARPQAQQAAILFCGDALFSLGCGRWFEGDAADFAALLDRLAPLADDTLLCCAHEYTAANARFARAIDPTNVALATFQREISLLRDRGEPTLPSTLARERAHNPYLRASTPGVLAGLAAHYGNFASELVGRLKQIREWKDGFS